MRTPTQPAIAFDDVGDGEPAFLFLTGWCAPRDVFRPLYPHLQRRGVALDWRGHGGSDPAPGDFGTAELLQDALAVAEAAGLDRLIPVATAHAGFVAIALRERLGAARVPGIALLDWMVLGAPPPFAGALAALQRPETWSDVRARLFEMWTTGVESRPVHDLIPSMARHGFEMWARGGREIAAAFAAHPVPLEAVAPMGCPTVHIYAQPGDEGFLAAQEAYRTTHPWFEVHRIQGRSHFPTLEAPAEVSALLEGFARRCA
jgi:pimeloyl-ACP methyl ester carboxylesterase